MQNSKPLFLFRAISSLDFYNPILTKEKCIYNTLNNIETSIFIDLNILCDIRKFMDSKRKVKINNFQNYLDINKTSLENVKNIIDLFKELKEVYISPSFALNEATSKYQLMNYEAFELFLQEYLPNFKDAYNATSYNPLINTLEKKQMQQLLSVIYASILCIHYIHKFYAHLSRLDKFKFLIDNMVCNIGLIDGVVAEIAKYSFFDEVPLDNNLQKMVNNFVKKSRDRKDIIRNSWNSAHDIHFFRTPVWIENNFFKKSIKIECWHLTNDSGIKYLSEILKFYEGNSYKIMSLYPENKSLENYMHECYIYQSNNLRRALSDKIYNLSAEELLEMSITKSQKFIKNIENELYKLNFS